MIKAVIFDFYGVVCNEIGSKWYRSVPPIEVVPELKEKYDAPSDTGKITEEEFFAGIGQSIHKCGSEVRADWLQSAEIDNEVVALIKELKANYRTALCSNTVTQLFKQLLQENELEELFDVIVASSEVGMVKPNPDIFKYTLKQLGIDPEEAIFIDDRETNVAGAKAVGMQAILYTDIALLRKELENILSRE